MRWKVVAVALLLVAGVMLWVYTSSPYSTWDGGFDLAVHVSSESDIPRSVTCQAFGHRETAEMMVEYLLPPDTRLYLTTVDPFIGEPISVLVPVSGNSSMSGRELHRVQFRYLTVIAVMPDGRRVGKLVDIPDCSVSREVSVVLP